MTSNQLKKQQTKPKFTDFEHGVLAALSCIVYGHGTDAETNELWELVGSPSSKEARARGADDYDVEAIRQIENYWAS